MKRLLMLLLWLPALAAAKVPDEEEIVDRTMDPHSPYYYTNLMAYAYGALGDPARERAYYARLQGVLQAIEASGDGLTQKTPRHILMFSHALDLLTTHNLSHGKSRIVSRTTEYIPLLAPRKILDKKVKGYYFDFSRIYWNKPDSVTYKRDRTWQFNNLRPREYK